MASGIATKSKEVQFSYGGASLLISLPEAFFSSGNEGAAKLKEEARAERRKTGSHGRLH